MRPKHAYIKTTARNGLKRSILEGKVTFITLLVFVRPALQLFKLQKFTLAILTPERLYRK
jgi:hypothetical protein